MLTKTKAVNRYPDAKTLKNPCSRNIFLFFKFDAKLTLSKTQTTAFVVLFRKNRFCLRNNTGKHHSNLFTKNITFTFTCRDGDTILIAYFNLNDIFV